MLAKIVFIFSLNDGSYESVVNSFISTFVFVPKPAISHNAISNTSSEVPLMRPMMVRFFWRGVVQVGYVFINALKIKKTATCGGCCGVFLIFYYAHILHRLVENQT
jgi:hypothetical protein